MTEHTAENDAPRSEAHEHEKCCPYLLCAHPKCCGYYGDPRVIPPEVTRPSS